MRLSRIFKVWFGLLAADAAVTVWEDRKAAREVSERVHGYPWPQAHDILDRCWKARPDVYDELANLSAGDRNAFIYGVFGMTAEKFREIFAFDRPKPE